jgi:PhoH-like ATPase
MTTRKRFVLDTNVLLHDPLALEHFADNEVIIPINVIEEIDQFKRELSERGRNARLVSRFIDQYRVTGGRLADGVVTAHGGLLRVALTSQALPTAKGARATADDLILQVALDERQRSADTPVIFVTKDTNLRIRADAMGLEAEDYTEEQVDISELYSGVAEIDLPGEDVDRFYSDGKLVLSQKLSPHQCVLLRNAANADHSALGRYQAREGCVVPLARLGSGVWGVRPRNKEQHFALDLLLQDDVKLVTLVGKAGTGKTLLAIAAGLQKVVEERRFQKMLVSRPIFPLGRDVGFLPGDIEQKLNPWMQPIYDNLEFLMGAGRGAPNNNKEPGYREFLEMGSVEVEPLTYIRGRSIPNQFMIVDEAQNLTPHEVKTIITRVGDNTKIVLTGDPYQIDNPYVDASNNGLTTVVQRFREYGLAGHITLLKGERSELAELAANVL